MMYGLFMKVVAADNISLVIDPIFQSAETSHGMLLLLAAILFGLQSKHVGSYRISYLAALENGRVLCEEAAYSQLHYEGTLDDGKLAFSLVSGAYDYGDLSSILIDGGQYSQNARGMNIVVYSNASHRILDRVSFDTFSQEHTAVR